MSRVSAQPLLFLSTMDGSSWGGSEELWFQTARHLATAGSQVVASVPKWPQPAKQLATLRQQGIPVIERPSPPAATVRVLHRIFPARKYAWLDRLRPRFVVLSQGSNWSHRTVEMGEALIRLGLPYLIVSHGGLPWHWPNDNTAAQMSAIYQRATAACFVCEANLALTQMQVGDPISNAVIVQNPFAVDYDSPLPWPEGEVPELAFVGQINPGIKGHDLLFQALATEPWRSREFKVVLYGSGAQTDLVRRLQDRLGLRNVFAGGVAAPREIWRRSHALILSSRAEGLPIVIVEAMLSGRPCICTAAGGCAEVVEDETTGFVARHISAEGIADALQRAWTRRNEWQAMGCRAAERIRTIVPADPAARFAALVERCAG